MKIHQEEEVDLKRDMYIPVAMAETLGIENSRMTVYHLTKEYEITKQGLRRWKKENGRVNAFIILQEIHWGRVPTWTISRKMQR